MKRTLVVLVAITGLAGVAACGSDSTSSSSAAPSTAAATTVGSTAAVATVAPSTAAPTTTAATTAAPTTATPTTAAATTAAATTAAPTTTAGAVITDPDAKAAADAYDTVFDSTVAFDQKAAHLADAAALQSTIDAYAQAGSQMGGIALKPTAAVVAGDTATVTYDVLFGGSAAYTSLEGHIAKVDGVWQVAKEEFCGFMAQARTPCPA